MKVPCFFEKYECRKFLIGKQLIPLSIGMIIGWILSLYLQQKVVTLAYLVTHKFTILSLVFGVIIGSMVGHLVSCSFFEKKTIIFGDSIFAVCGFLIFFKIQSIKAILIFAILYGFIKSLLACGLIKYLSDLVLKKRKI